MYTKVDTIYIYCTKWQLKNGTIFIWSTWNNQLNFKLLALNAKWFAHCSISTCKFCKDPQKTILFHYENVVNSYFRHKMASVHVVVVQCTVHSTFTHSVSNVQRYSFVDCNFLWWFSGTILLSVECTIVNDFDNK